MNLINFIDSNVQDRKYPSLREAGIYINGPLFRPDRRGSFSSLQEKSHKVRITHHPSYELVDLVTVR